MEKTGVERGEIRLPRWVQHLVFGGAVTSLGALVYTLTEKEPKLVIETLQKFGPQTFLGLVALVILDRSFKTGTAMLREGIAAQQRLADAVQSIAQRDDERSREMELVVDHLARGMKEVKNDTRAAREEITALRRDLMKEDTKERAHGHSAGG